MPGIVDRVGTVRGQPTLALTFDACGGPGGRGYDADLIALLRAERIPATLFLNERWVRVHRGLTAELARDRLFAIASHGSRHSPLSVDGRSAYGIAGTRSGSGVLAEIEPNQRLLTEVTGTVPRWFRAGTAHYDDVAVEIVRRSGLRVAGFTVNADDGATARPDSVRQRLVNAPDGAIVLAHMNQPRGATCDGLRAALPALKAARTRFVRLT